MLLNLVVLSTALLVVLIALLCLSTMEEETIVKDAGETPSLQSSSEKPKSRSRSKRSKSLVADVPVKTGAVFRDPVTGKFRSANVSGSELIIPLDKSSQNSDSVRVPNVDVIAIDRTDISALPTDFDMLSSRLFQSEDFQASLLQAVQRAQPPMAQSQQPATTTVPPYGEPTSVGGRLPSPIWAGQRSTTRLDSGVTGSHAWMRLADRGGHSYRPRSRTHGHPTSTITAPPSVPLDPYGTDGTVGPYAADGSSDESPPPLSYQGRPRRPTASTGPWSTVAPTFTVTALLPNLECRCARHARRWA